MSEHVQQHLEAATALRARLDALRGDETAQATPPRRAQPAFCGRRAAEDPVARREARLSAERARLAGPTPGAQWWLGETALRAGFAALTIVGVLILSATIGRAETRASLQIEGTTVEGPAGWTRFCAAAPSACAGPTVARPGAVATIDADDLIALRRFNASVNAAYAPVTDAAAHGVVDLWSLPGPETGWAADCEDYVLAKRAALLAAGWPPEAVLIGVVVGADAPYHAVLVLRTSLGELVLDNLTDDVLPWAETGYTWVVRQSAQAPQRWVRLVAG